MATPFITRGQTLALAAIGCVLLSPCVIGVGVVLVKRVPEGFFPSRVHHRDAADTNVKSQIANMNQMAEIFDSIMAAEDFHAAMPELKDLAGKRTQLEAELDAMGTEKKMAAIEANKVEYAAAKQRLTRAIRDTRRGPICNFPRPLDFRDDSDVQLH